MATVPNPRTWSAGEYPSPTQLNTEIRDALNFLLAPPLAVLRQTVAQSIANSTSVFLLWDTEDIDSDSAHSLVTNTDRFVAQSAGWYRVEASVGFAVNASGYRFLRLDVNGTFHALAEIAAAPGVTTIINGGKTVYLNVGDYVAVGVNQNSGGALNTVIVERSPWVSFQWLSK